MAAYDDTIKKFPDNVVAPSGRAEVLKEMGRFEDALAAYDETIKHFPNGVVSRTGRASLLTLMGELEEVWSILPDEHPISRNDWIAYHILAMSYLKSGNAEEAVKRLAYGLENAPWINIKNYYATALAVARIRSKKFPEAVEVLKKKVADLDIFQTQKRLIFIGHSQAELGERTEAIAALAPLANTQNPRITRTRNALLRRYNLGLAVDKKLSETESAILERQIYEEEFFLAMAA